MYASLNTPWQRIPPSEFSPESPEHAKYAGARNYFGGYTDIRVD